MAPRMLSAREITVKGDLSASKEDTLGQESVIKKLEKLLAPSLNYLINISFKEKILGEESLP